MYGSIVEAFKGLVGSEDMQGNTTGNGYRITRLSDEGTYLCNGLDYCFVEVTFADGVQYGIDAYGDEAIALRKEALGAMEGHAAKHALVVATIA